MERKMTKKINSKGGVTIPSEIRLAYGIQPGDPFELSTNESGDIVLKRAVERCCLCGSDKSVELINGKGLCQKCAKLYSVKKKERKDVK